MTCRRLPALLVGLLPLAAFASWQTTLVDGATENTGTTVALDAAGTAHVAYYSSAGLKYARRDSSGWSVTVLDAWTGPHNRGPSLALDSLDRPCIAYYRGTPWLARWTGSDWQHEEIDPDSSGDYISLVFDSLGYPQVAYNKRIGLFDSQLKYARRDGTGWHPELVDGTASGYDCVLRFGSAGLPVVVDCESWSSGALFSRARTDSGWTRTTLLSADASQSFLALGPAGELRVSYYWTGGEDYDLRFAWLDGDSWRFELVDHGQQPYKRGWDNCIAVDRQGTCHVSYHCHNECELRYAWGRPGNWSVEVVDTVGLWNLTSSVALDSGGRAWIAYCDEDEGDALYVAVRDDPVGVEQTPEYGARPFGQVPSDGSIANCPTICHGVLRIASRLTADGRQPGLLDASGRKVMNLQPGANDVSHLAPGVYFLRPASGLERPASGVRKVVITR